MTTTETAYTTIRSAAQSLCSVASATVAIVTTSVIISSAAYVDIETKRPNTTTTTISSIATLDETVTTPRVTTTISSSATVTDNHNNPVKTEFSLTETGRFVFNGADETGDQSIHREKTDERSLSTVITSQSQAFTTDVDTYATTINSIGITAIYNYVTSFVTVRSIAYADITFPVEKTTIINGIAFAHTTTTIDALTVIASEADVYHDGIQHTSEVTTTISSAAEVKASIGIAYVNYGFGGRPATGLEPEHGMPLTDFLRYPETLLYDEMLTYGRELGDQKNRITDAENDMYLHSATGNFLDVWGDYFVVTRMNNETDSAYRLRIINSILRVNQNNIAIQMLIKDAFGYDATIHDAILMTGDFSEYLRHCFEGRFYMQFSEESLDKLPTNPDELAELIGEIKRYVNARYKAAGTAWIDRLDYRDIEDIIVLLESCGVKKSKNFEEILWQDTGIYPDGSHNIDEGHILVHCAHGLYPNGSWYIGNKTILVGKNTLLKEQLVIRFNGLIHDITDGEYSIITTKR